MPFQMGCLGVSRLLNWHSEKLTLMFSLKIKTLGPDEVDTSAKLLNVVVSSLVRGRSVFRTLSHI